MTAAFLLAEVSSACPQVGRAGCLAEQAGRLRSWWLDRGWPGGLFELIWMVAAAAAILAFALLTVMFLIYLERKVAADIQSRLGPMRVGPYGTLQSVADGLKLILKEDVIPAAADRWLFIIAPFLVFVPAVLVYIVLPFSPGLIVRDLNLGLLYVVAVASFPVLGVFMAGWGANNKYSLLGAMRAAAQAVSYEIPLVLAMLVVIMAAGSVRLGDIVDAQAGQLFGFLPRWNLLLMPVGFLLWFCAAMAEINRVPFDLPEAESELVAGYHTEYSGIRFGLFFMGEYAHTFFIAGLCVTLFLGGWQGPFLPPVIWFLLKTYAVIFLMMWVRWTLPRLRVDQLMAFSWKFLVPVALVHLMIYGIVLAL